MCRLVFPGTQQVEPDLKFCTFNLEPVFRKSCFFCFCMKCKMHRKHFLCRYWYQRLRRGLPICYPTVQKQVKDQRIKDSLTDYSMIPGQRSCDSKQLVPYCVNLSYICLHFHFNHTDYGKKYNIQ